MGKTQIKQRSIPWNSIEDPGIGLLSTNRDRLIDFHFRSEGIGFIGTHEIVNAHRPCDRCRHSHFRPDDCCPVQRSKQ